MKDGAQSADEVGRNFKPGVCRECGGPLDGPGYLHDSCDTLEVLEA